MAYKWYNLFNKQEFLDLDLVSKTLTVTLEGIGQKDVLITKGNEVSITYEGILLPIGFIEKNPYARDGFAVWLDENENVWLGVAIT